MLHRESLPDDQAALLVSRGKQTTHEIIVHGRDRTIVTAHLLHHLPLESVPIVKRTVAISSKHQGLRRGKAGMGGRVEEILMLELCHRFVHF